MKRIFILIVALIACASQIFAQIAIFNEQDEEITNTTVNIQAGVQIEYYFTVKNIGSTTKENLVAYLMVNGILANSEQATVQLCTNNLCGGPSSSPKFTLQPGEEETVHMTLTTLSATDFAINVSPRNNENSPEASFLIHAGTTGISNINANSFNVYPSPANESFTIENGFGKNSYVEIYNVLGQMVKHVASDNSNRISVNCSSWKNGYYVCRLYKDGKAEKTVKIVIAH